MTQDEFDKRNTHNVALSGAMDSVIKRMRDITDRPIGQAQPCVIQTLCAVLGDMLALRK